MACLESHLRPAGEAADEGGLVVELADEGAVANDLEDLDPEALVLSDLGALVVGLTCEDERNELPHAERGRHLRRWDGLVGDVVSETVGGYEVTLTLFLPPGSDPAATTASLLPDWLVHGLSLTIGEPIGAASGSSKSHPLFLAAAESLRQAYPGTPVGSAFLSASVTDGRFFRQLGIPTYGFSPFLFFTTDTMWVDRSNERIPVPGFLSGSEIYSALVKRLVLAGEM